MDHLVQKIDDFLFDRLPGFQKITNFFEYYLGITHVTLAQFVVIVGTAYTGAISWQNAVTESGSGGWWTLFLQGVLVILFLIQAQLLQGTTSKAGRYRNALRSPGLHMNFRVLLMVINIVKLFSVVANDIFEWWRVAGTLSVSIGFYLLACDKLPPGERFLDRFKKRATVH